MQPLTQVFLVLLLAHLLGDFPFQTGRMVDGKMAREPGAFFAHLGVHLALTVAALALFVPGYLGHWATPLAVALLIAGHLALDLCKSTLIGRRPSLDGGALFLIDQLLHIAIVGAAAMIIVRATPSTDPLWSLWLDQRDRVLVFTTILLLTVFPAGYLIRYLLKPLSRELAESDNTESVRNLSNAGLYLGWVERALLVVAFSMGSFTAVGLIVGAKSVARYPEFKSRDFAEYFLIGTLMSVTIAAIGGWVLHLALSNLTS